MWLQKLQCHLKCDIIKVCAKQYGNQSKKQVALSEHKIRKDYWGGKIKIREMGTPSNELLMILYIFTHSKEVIFVKILIC